MSRKIKGHGLDLDPECVVQHEMANRCVNVII
jgi:hypothetical protein